MQLIDIKTSNGEKNMQIDSDLLDLAIKKQMKEIGNKYFFSLNRYERKKNINLAIFKIIYKSFF